MLGIELYFKKEFLQVTGSFKERGACYALLCLPQVRLFLVKIVQQRILQEKHAKGVIAASAGNHALALAYHGQRLSALPSIH